MVATQKAMLSLRQPLFHCVFLLTHHLGVMAARGMLQNPAMFAGFDDTPLSCVEDWVSWQNVCGRIISSISDKV